MELDVSVLPNAWKYRTASIEERYELAQDLNPYEKAIPEQCFNRTERTI